MKIREVISEAPVVKKPVQPVQSVDPAQQKQAATGQPPASGQPQATNNPADGSQTGTGPAKPGAPNPTGVQGAKNLAQTVGQAVATGAEKTANVVAKGAQATHDVATKAAGALDQGTSVLQKMRQGYANLDRGGKSAPARSSDAGDAFDGVDSNELKVILSKVSQGQKLDPRELSLMRQAHDRI
jgi:hypothetical protein